MQKVGVRHDILGEGVGRGVDHLVTVGATPNSLKRGLGSTPSWGGLSGWRIQSMVVTGPHSLRS